MTTKNEKALATNTDSKAVTVQLPGDYDLVTSAGKMQWAQIKDDPQPFDMEVYRQQDQPMENVIEGVLLGKEDLEPDKNGEVRSYYKIQLVRPCITQEGKGKDAIVGRAEIGEVVAVGERMKLEPLDTLLATGNVYRVLIHAAEKIEVNAGKNTMWTFNIGKVLLKAAPQYTAPDTQASA